MTSRLAMTLALLLALGCGRGENRATTTTIAPAEPRPAPTPVRAIGDQPVIETAGSPTPEQLTTGGRELIILYDGRIDVRPAIPRANTLFVFANRGTMPHWPVVRGDTQSAQTPGPIATGPEVLLQVTLTGTTYEVVCAMPGHAERATFIAYTPGQPLGR